MARVCKVELSSVYASGGAGSGPSTVAVSSATASRYSEGNIPLLLEVQRRYILVLRAEPDGVSSPRRPRSKGNGLKRPRRVSEEDRVEWLAGVGDVLAVGFLEGQVAD